MKMNVATVIAALFASHAAFAQVVVPGMPGKFDSRGLGGGTSAGVHVQPKKSGKVKYTTHIILAESRIWTSSEGKPLDAKLLAFEELVVEIPEGSAQPPTPKPPPHPTVVRGDKVRLLPSNNKPVEVALSRLSQPDRDFIEQLRKAHAAKTPAAE